ncbi:MAG: lipopolysaccharide transport periplasmic protein LptA [Epsilonproteobacteria bacterium]|nr:lipopolysaccharide transport periplasmic protein LptA [Campylobacterota bacterium]
MKKLILIGLLLLTSWAENIEINADKFIASQKELISQFIGNVVLKTSKDTIKASRVYIYFNKRKKPIKVEAVGGVRFKIKDENGKVYEGRAKRVIYYPLKKEYYLKGDVHITQIPDKKKIFAQNIYINLRSSRLVVEGGDKKPVKMIFTIDEK